MAIEYRQYKVGDSVPGSNDGKIIKKKGHAYLVKWCDGSEGWWYGNRTKIERNMHWLMKTIDDAPSLPLKGGQMNEMAIPMPALKKGQVYWRHFGWGELHSVKIVRVYYGMFYGKRTKLVDYLFDGKNYAEGKPYQVEYSNMQKSIAGVRDIMPLLGGEMNNEAIEKRPFKKGDKIHWIDDVFDRDHTGKIERIDKVTQNVNNRKKGERLYRIRWDDGNYGYWGVNDVEDLDHADSPRLKLPGGKMNEAIDSPTYKVGHVIRFSAGAARIMKIKWGKRYGKREKLCLLRFDDDSEGWWRESELKDHEERNEHGTRRQLPMHLIKGHMNEGLESFSQLNESFKAGFRFTVGRPNEHGQWVQAHGVVLKVVKRGPKGTLLVQLDGDTRSFTIATNQFKEALGREQGSLRLMGGQMNESLFKRPKVGDYIRWKGLHYEILKVYKRPAVSKYGEDKKYAYRYEVKTPDGKTVRWSDEDVRVTDGQLVYKLPLEGGSMNEAHNDWPVGTRLKWADDHFTVLKVYRGRKYDGERIQRMWKVKYEQRGEVQHYDFRDMEAIQGGSNAAEKQFNRPVQGRFELHGRMNEGRDDERYPTVHTKMHVQAKWQASPRSKGQNGYYAVHHNDEEIGRIFVDQDRPKKYYAVSKHKVAKEFIDKRAGQHWLGAVHLGDDLDEAIDSKSYKKGDKVKWHKEDHRGIVTWEKPVWTGVVTGVSYENFDYPPRKRKEYSVKWNDGMESSHTQHELDRHNNPQQRLNIGGHMNEAIDKPLRFKPGLRLQHHGRTGTVVNLQRGNITKQTYVRVNWDGPDGGIDMHDIRDLEDTFIQHRLPLKGKMNEAKIINRYRIGDKVVWNGTHEYFYGVIRGKKTPRCKGWQGTPNYEIEWFKDPERKIHHGTSSNTAEQLTHQMNDELPLRWGRMNEAMVSEAKQTFNVGDRVRKSTGVVHNRTVWKYGTITARAKWSPRKRPIYMVRWDDGRTEKCLSNYLHLLQGQGELLGMPGGRMNNSGMNEAHRDFKPGTWVKHTKGWEGVVVTDEEGEKLRDYEYGNDPIGGRVPVRVEGQDIPVVAVKHSNLMKLPKGHQGKLRLRYGNMRNP